RTTTWPPSAPGGTGWTTPSPLGADAVRSFCRIFSPGKGERVSWLHWAVLSALFAGLTAVLAKVGVREVDSNLATAIRTAVILVFAWSVALVARPQPLSAVPPRAWLFLVLSGLA